MYSNIQNRIHIADMVVILFTEGNAFVIDCKLFPVDDGGEIRNLFAYSSFDTLL